MVGLGISLSSTVSRLNLLMKQPFCCTIRTHLREQKRIPTLSFTSFPFTYISNSLFSTSNVDSQKTHIGNSATRDDLVILGIETSCDDTAAAVVRSNGEILSQVVSSQEDLLAQYGGVSPKMAEEAHSQVIDQVVQQALDEANLTEIDLSAVAVTIGPGLSLCLRGNLVNITVLAFP